MKILKLMTNYKVSVSMQIIHADQIPIMFMSVTIRLVMDTRHSVYPSLILTHCDSILRIIAVRVSVDTRLLKSFTDCKRRKKSRGN